MANRPPHHRPGGGFRNPDPRGAPRPVGDLLRWFRERGRTRRERPDPSPAVFTRATPRFAQPRRPGDLAVTWLGHSTALLEFAGLTVLTDPILSDYPAPIPVPRLRRWVPAPVGVSALPRVDLVLVSHNHYDHLDAPTVRALARRFPDAAWCTPLGNATLLRKLGARAVHEVDWWNEVKLAGAATVTCTPAQHFSSRGLHDRDRALWAGFVVRAGGRTAWFAGDTGYFGGMREIGERAGSLDLVLAPAGAYDPRWFMRPVHMDPEEAVQATLDVADGQVPRLVPIHWGTFKLTDEPMDEPPRRTREAWRAAGLEEERLWLLAHGETRLLAGAGTTP